MSYVLANTSNPLGRRGLGRMGWDNAPYPLYPISPAVARLNGDFNPAGQDPSTNAHGAITYRVDPRTGQYQFYRTDIKPRGVFMQNTFQHPAPPVMSALGVRVLPPGSSVTASTMQRGRSSRGPLMRLNPAINLSGLGCNCGRCSSPLSRRTRRRGMGASECDFDSDCGPGGACAAGFCVIQEIPVVSNTSTPPIAPVPVPRVPVDVITTPSSPISLVQVPSLIANALRPPAAPQQASWWDQKTNVGGMIVSNPVLAGGAVAFAFLLAGMGGKRR
jgi:hypothetical protein